MTRFPNTPSQRWALAQGACFSGRKRLGKKSICEFWLAHCHVRTWQAASDLLWVLDHLTREEGNRTASFVQALYRHSRITTKMIREAAATNHITIPMELL